MACSACERIDRGRAGRDPDFVAALPESSVFLADEQTYRGYCLVFMAEHVEQLDEVPIDRQVRLWEDVARLAAALRVELAPARINFASLGNFLAHVHWHVIPRYADDPEPLPPSTTEIRPAAKVQERSPNTGRLPKAMATCCSSTRAPVSIRAQTL